MMAHQGQGYTYIPPQERTRQRPIDSQLRSQLRETSASNGVISVEHRRRRHRHRQ